jgi:PAS domain S-box-containing protein
VTDKRVLVVEDDRVTAEGITRTLNRLGYTTLVPVATGEEAIAQTVAQQPDLVLMDIKLQGPMLGVVAAERIRQQCDVPIVYLTAYVDDQTIAAVKGSRPYGFVNKPYESRELDVAIEMALYLHHMERQLRESEARYRTLVRNFPDGMVALFDRDTRFTLVDGAGTPGVCLSSELAQGKLAAEALTPDMCALIEPCQRAALDGQGCHLEVPHGDRVCEVQTLPIRGDNGAIVAGMLLVRDITERKQAELERERLIAELRETLDHVKVLRGLLPICMNCKKIRDDQGYWQKIEVYIRKHSEAEFSHGLCPECAHKLYPEFMSAPK